MSWSEFLNLVVGSCVFVFFIRITLSCSEGSDCLRCQKDQGTDKITYLLSKASPGELNSDIQGCTACCILASGMQENGERMRKWRGKGERIRKWRGNGEKMRKWRENEEMERDSLSTFPLFLFISSLSNHFLYQRLSHFVAKMLNTALLSRMSQKI